MKKLMMVILGVIFLISCSGETSATFDLDATKLLSTTSKNANSYKYT